MTLDPRLTGKDAVAATAAQLTSYDLEIVRAFNDLAIMPQFFGSRSIDGKGLKILSHKKAYKVKPPSNSEYGDEENVANFKYTEVQANFLYLNQMYELKAGDIAYAAQSGVGLETESARAVGDSIAEQLDYNIYNGVNSPIQMNGMLEDAAVIDAGAPAGVWDTSSMYTDILKIIGDVRSAGYNGALNMGVTAGLRKNFDQFVLVGTTQLAKTYFEWVSGLLSGGQIFFSSHFATAASGPSQADKVTGSGATNQVIVSPPNGVSAQVVYGTPLESLERPAQDGDVYKNVKLKYTFQIKNPQWVAFMDAIDPTT